MRKFNIPTTPTDSLTKEEIRTRLLKLKVKDQSVDKLLEESNDENIHRINDLLAGAEEIILRVMLSLPVSSYSIDDRLSNAT